MKHEMSILIVITLIAFVAGYLFKTATGSLECELLKKNAPIFEPGTYTIETNCESIPGISFENPEKQPLCIEKLVKKQ